MRLPAVVLAASLVAASGAAAVGAPPDEPTFDGTMTLEPVEPHVVRVLDDGAGHDLTDPNTFEDLKPVSLLAAGDDGSVWMTSSGGFIKLGTPGEVVDPLETFLAQMEIGPDGALWIAHAYRGTTAVQPAPGAIGRWHDGAWTIHELPSDARVVWLDATPDGGLDFGWRDETTLTFGALQPGREDWVATPPPPLRLASLDGSIDVERTSDGRIWVAEGPMSRQRFEPAPLWTFDGSAWEPIEPVGDLSVQPAALTVEASGTLLVSWLEVVADTGRPGSIHLTRREANGDWTVIPDADDDGKGGSRRRCLGHARFDGQQTTRYLDGTCLRSIAATPSGDIWAFGYDRRRQNPGIYVISPDR